MAKQTSKKINKLWRRYEYKHTTLAILAIVLFVTFLDSALLVAAFDWLRQFGYVAGFIGGILLASFFTAIPAFVLIVSLANQLDPLLLALFVGLGNAVGDMLLLLFFEEKIFYELKPLFRKLGLAKLVKNLRRRRSAFMLLVGIFFIVTPLPDEVGLSLLGLSRFPKIYVMVICLGLNTLGAALIIVTAKAIGG